MTTQFPSKPSQPKSSTTPPLKHISLSLFFLFFLTLTSCTDPKKEVPKLLSKLTNSDPHTRSEACIALGRIGAPHATKAVPQLIYLLKDPNPGVASGAAYALRNIDTPEARKALDSARQFGK